MPETLVTREQMCIQKNLVWAVLDPGQPPHARRSMRAHLVTRFRVDGDDGVASQCRFDLQGIWTNADMENELPCSQCLTWLDRRVAERQQWADEEEENSA